MYVRINKNRTFESKISIHIPKLEKIEDTFLSFKETFI